MTEQSLARFDASKIIREHLENVRNYIIFQMDAYGRNASGKSVRSLTIEANMGTGVLYGKKNWIAMETGRGGRNNGSPRFPRNFRQIIYQWTIDKGIAVRSIPYKTNRPHKYTPEQRGRMTFAYFVARKIMQDGTALFRSGVRQDIYSSAINREVAAIMNESNLRVGEIISNINKNAF